MNFFKRMQAVLQIRTGFVAVATSVIGLIYSIKLELDVNWLVMILFITSAFAVNIVTNIANGIAGASREDTLETINDEYVGKNGLVTGITSHKDAYIALGLFTGYTIASGLLIVLLTKAIWFLLIGIVSVVIALVYSLGPKPLTDYPVTEVVSGIFCGALPTMLVVIFNGSDLTVNLMLLAIISLLLVAMLMLTNNMCDVEKDRGHRKTIAHLISQKRLTQFYLMINLTISGLGLIVLSLLSGIVFVVINTLLFITVFYKPLNQQGVDFKGNKGFYIPKYLKYYYRIITILCILLLF